MVSGDPETPLLLVFAREQVCTKKSFTICVIFLNIIVSGDPIIKKALTVGVAREQACTKKSSTIFVIS